MSLPGLVYLVVYKFVPLIGLSLAFKDYDMFAGTGLLDSMLKSEWVGLGYFRRIFSGPQF
jgi:putative aldouronate transport system permease protein